MHHYMAQQFIVLARDRDGDSWTNLLFLIVLAVFWLVGGLAKAKAEKMERQKQKDASRKPRVRPPSASGGAVSRPTARRQQQRPSKPSTPPPIPAKKTQMQHPHRPMQRPTQVKSGIDRALRSEPSPSVPGVYDPEAEITGSSPITKPQVQTTEISPTFTSLSKLNTRIEPLQIYGKQTPEEIAQTTYLPEILAAYDDPDRLKQAFLSLEILGKPVSMRPPQDQNVIEP